MSEAIDRVRAFVDAWPGDRRTIVQHQELYGQPYELLHADLRELLAGYIPPEHHAAIRAALHYTERDSWDEDGRNDESIRAALAAMPKAGA